MIAWSDNTATNLLVGLTGVVRTNRRMEGYDLRNTKIFRPTFRDGKADVFPELEHEFGLGMTTPADTGRLFELIAEGKIVDRATSDEMLAILALQQDRAMIPRRLPFERDRIFGSTAVHLVRDRKRTRLNSSHMVQSRMPSSA